MTDPQDRQTNRLLEVCRLLNRESARYVVVGGHACALHGLVRATKDVDILIPRVQDEADRVHRALTNLPLGLAREIEPSDLLAKPFTIIGDWPRVDVLLAAGSVSFDQVWPTHLEREIEGVVVPYASLGILIRTKETDRLRDQADVQELRLIQERQKEPPA